MRLDLGLLFLRLSAGGMLLLGHGLGKLGAFSEVAGVFPDPLGMGSTFTLLVAIFAEVFCASLVVVGLSTRLATLPILGTLLTAATVVHAGDPWAKKEFALLYAVPFFTLLLTGPGSFSLDGVYKLRKASRP
jgi:putative oxidoreductase